ncbi:MAG: capsule assembly Wzi family protein [Gemmatimonadota bacterium]
MVLLLCAPITAAAQAPGADDGVGRCSAPSLAADHWAGTALLRLHALGALDTYLPAQRAIPACVAAEMLEAASDHEVAGTLAADWLGRLREEYPGLATERLLIGGRVEAGLEARDGAGAPGGGGLFPPERLGTLPLEDLANPWIGGEVAFAADRVALSAGGRLGASSSSLRSFEATVDFGAVAATLGRGSVGYGATTAGGIVLSQARLDRIQIETPRAVRLPSPLRNVGVWGFSTLLGRLNEERHPYDPYFWAATGSYQPHWRATLSVHRAAMIGGEGGEPITIGSLLNTLVGRVVGGGAENQVVSVEGRFHLPSERLLPLTAYVEWGADDTAGAWWDVPARTLGLFAPSLPGASALAIGVERTGFARTCCGNPMWYRHWAYPGGWAHGDRPLGHPLGGHGTEWLVYADGSHPGAGVGWDARVFRRDRRDDNLFVPGRENRSVGAAAGARWRVTPGAEIFGALSVERGDSWRERHLAIGGTIFYR